MRTWITIVCVLALTALCSWFARAADPASPSIAGSYVLDYRELPDGKQVRPPEVGGMLTFTRDHRNFNVFWHDGTKVVAISTISKYTLNAGEYTEQNIFHTEHNVVGKETTLETKPIDGKAAVKMNGDKIEFKLPLFGEPEAVFDAKGLTATRAGAFVDHWKKID